MDLAPDADVIPAKAFATNYNRGFGRTGEGRYEIVLPTQQEWDHERKWA
jgi:hypothetical protein